MTAHRDDNPMPPLCLVTPTTTRLRETSPVSHSEVTGCIHSPQTPSTSNNGDLRRMNAGEPKCDGPAGKLVARNLVKLLSPYTLHHIWRVRVAFVATLSLLSAFLLAPGTALASCGSYVTPHSSGKNAAQPLVPQAGFGQAPLADHSGKPWPCSSTTCSNRPLVPPLPAVPSARPPQDEASGIAAFTLAAETSSAPLAESLPPQHPLQHPRSIFRPPRLPRHSR
jgi:hypothetical protein